MVENLGKLNSFFCFCFEDFIFDNLRSQREQELDYFQRKKFGQLSDKVNKRIEKYHTGSRTDLSLSTEQQQQQQPVFIEPSQ
jgi:hypothetical protein